MNWLTGTMLWRQAGESSGANGNARMIMYRTRDPNPLELRVHLPLGNFSETWAVNSAKRGEA